MQRIGVVGAGQMGLGIAHICALNNYHVTLIDSIPKKLEKGGQLIDLLLKKDVLKGKISQAEMDEAKKRLSVGNDLLLLKNMDLVVEAVVESSAVKKELFMKLDEIVKKDGLLATNTSSISITKIASATNRSEKVIGIHFMNPVPVMKLVEIIPGLNTSARTIAQTMEFVKSLNKTATTSVDYPGFIANRILMPMINEAIMVLQEGVATKEDIDTTMKLGTNVPMGPLVLADFIGLDTCLAIMRVLHTQIGDDKYRPAALLVKYVDAGWYGKKSGRGFYEY